MTPRQTAEHQRLGAGALSQARDDRIARRHGGGARQRAGQQNDLVTAPGKPLGKAFHAQRADMRKVRMTMSDDQDFDGAHRAIL